MTDPRDPHLLAALRHAPDRDAAPPPEVTARILDAARAAVRPARSRPVIFERWIAWFARPQVGAAFATLAVATLVGVLWSTQDVPVADSVSPQVTAAEIRQRQETAPAAQTAAQPAQTPPAAPPPAPGERRLAKRIEAVPPMLPSRDAAAAGKVLAETAPPANAFPAAPPAEALRTAPPAPELRAAPPEATLGRADAVRPPPPAAAPGQRLRNESPAAAQEAGALAAAKPATAAPMRADPAAAYDPLMALDVRDTAAWAWVAAGAERAHGAAQRALWATMRAATQGRWDAAPTARAAVPWLVLRDGAQQTQLLLADGALYLTDAEGRTWRASVTPEQARDWQQAVSRW
jgi:hypothetical protein